MSPAHILSVCKRGHPFTPENTYRRRDGYKECRTCIRARRHNQRRTEVTCPDCGLTRLVQRQRRTEIDRRNHDGVCQPCSVRRANDFKTATPIERRSEYEQFWLDRFSLEEIRELWADVSLYLAMDERGRMAA